MKVTNGNTASETGIIGCDGTNPDNFNTKALCPVRDILDRIGDKWSIHTIILLGQGKVLRFNEMKKQIDGISQRMLTVTLRSLEEDGFISRKIYAEVPPRVEYALTELGKSLLVQLLSLSKWAYENLDQVVTSREKHILTKV
jgi:DNA-binding HxlR family transcriptional regulator